MQTMITLHSYANCRCINVFAWLSHFNLQHCFCVCVTFDCCRWRVYSENCTDVYYFTSLCNN